MKKILVPVLLVILLLGWLAPGAAQAAGGIVITDSSAKVDFPNDITVSIAASSDAAINDIRVHYTVTRLSEVDVVSEAYVAIAPAKSVKTQWVWDMKKTGGLPPGTAVTYWVTVKDNAGHEEETLPASVRFNDTRFDWQQTQQGQITLYWYEGDTGFAAELVTAAQQALDRLADNTGAQLATPVTFYIYANQTDLLGSMIFSQEWTGGVAFAEYGVISIGIGTTADELTWGESTIAHELTHLVEDQVTMNPYNTIPTWLSEGLAMYAEGPLDLTFVLTLSTAEANNSFISVRSLCSPFPADYNQALLSYAESEKIVEYLINDYGRDKFFQFMNAFKVGTGYDEALKNVYGFDMDGLNTLWRTEPVAVYTPVTR